MTTHQILATEEMVGADHATKSDTLNRFINLITAQGDILYGTAAKTAAALAKGAANAKFFINAGATAPEWAVGMSIGGFTIDTATASGDQVVSGVGFKLSVVIFFAAVDTTAEGSWGFDTGVARLSNTINREGSAGIFQTAITDSIVLYQAAGITYRGEISAIGADGFTITWTKLGAKTGTADIYYLALR